MKRLVYLFTYLSLAVSAQVPTSGLIGEWTFSGNANDGAGTNNGTVYGATLVADRCGNSNSAYSFNGTSDYIQMLSSGPTGTLSRTVSFWEKTTNTTIYSPRSSFDYGTATGSGDSYQVEWNYCAAGVGLDLSNQAIIRGNDCLLNNTWHHIAIVYNATLSTVYSNADFYIDGVLQTAIACNVSGTTATVNTGATYPITIGRAATSAARYFIGELDDVYLYNRALSAAEVLQLYNYMLPCPTRVTGNTLVCQGAPVIYSIAPVSNATYTWTLPGGWTGTSATNTISVTAGTGSGSISVAISSTCGVFATLPLGVSSLSLPVISAVSSNPVLCGTGSQATLSATGGSSYTWTPPTATGSSIVVSPASTTIYTVNAIAVNGCTAAAMVTQSISALPAIAISGAVQICQGGVSTLSASGAVAYTWQPGNLNGSLVTVSPPATTVYTVTGLANGCTANVACTLTVLAAPTLTVASGNQSVCNGSSITLTVSGGTSYTWQPGGTNGPVLTVSPAAATIYSLSESGASGCISNMQFTVSVLPVPVVTIAASSTLVCAGNQVTLTAGGAASYTWSNPYATGPVITNNVTVPSVYSVFATAANGCTTAANSSIAIKAVPTLSFNTAAITCASLGSATVSAIGGTGPFSYTWVPALQTGATATGLMPGVYSITVLDAGTGCVSTSTTMFTPLVPLTGTISSTPGLTCNALNTATAAIVLSGGSGVQSYLWTDINGSQSTASATGLAAGINTVTVTDQLTFCSVTQTFQVTQPPAATISLAFSQASVCLGTAIGFTATNSGGSPPYNYSWANGPATNTYLVNESVAGTYVYTLSSFDAYNCSSSRTVTATFVPSPTLNISLSSATTCAELFNGSPNTITLTSSGANTYTISTPNDIYNSNPSGPITNLNTLPPHVPGVSTATLYGSNGVCTLSTTAVFTIVPNPTVTINSYTPVICAGQTFTYTNAGADSYSWSSSTSGQTLYTTGNIAVADPTTNAVFSVFGGSLGCNSAEQTTTITVNPLPTLLLTPEPAVTCLNIPLVLTASGTGTAYTWQPPYFLSTAQGATVSANPPTQQNYTVIASLNSCTASAIITVSVLPLPDLTITSSNQNVLCLNQTFTFQAGGGSSYSWQYPNHLSAVGPSVNIDPVNISYSGTYTLTAMGANGCSNVSTIDITVKDSPGGYLQSNDLGSCAPFCGNYQFIATNYAPSDITVTGWQVNGKEVPPGDHFSYCFSDPGDFLVKGTLVSTYGCANTVTLMIHAYPKPVADFTFSPERPVENFDEVNFVSTPGNQNISKFNWYFISNDPSNTSTVASPAYLFETAGTYPVALIIKNQWGCMDSIVKTITVESDFAVYVPNAFTPNADSRNELFYPVIRGVQLLSFMVYDRWGEKVFSTNVPGTGWDGNYRGQPCKEDVYVWKLEATSSSHENKKLNGFVTLYR